MAQIEAREADHIETIPQLVTGVDVSDRYSTFCTISEAGETQEEGRIRTSPVCSASIGRTLSCTGPSVPANTSAYGRFADGWSPSATGRQSAGWQAQLGYQVRQQ